MFDFFKIKQYKQQIEELSGELELIKASFTPEMHDAVKLQKHIAELTEKIEEIKIEKSSAENQLSELEKTIKSKEKQIIQLDEEILIQSFGIYKPMYDFALSEQYKNRLDAIRDEQKRMVRNGTAVTGNMSWQVNGSSSQGKKMVKDMQKLLLRAFNSECDEIISRVKYNNFEASSKRINSSYMAISNLGKVMDIAISSAYYNRKIDELHLALEYQIKKQAEKEEQKELRAQMREEAKLLKEIEDARKKTEKEKAHYENALAKIISQIEKSSDDAKDELIKKKDEIERQLIEVEKSLKDIDYREANKRAGYVYIISNIGAFGEDVYKIGMTRRLDPTERIDELGDASVPFNFDIHAMIFSDDAPALENALHKAFENKKLNMVNTRREFFNVSLDEIKKVVSENFDKTIEFIDTPDAEQYRISQKLRK